VVIVSSLAGTLIKISISSQKRCRKLIFYE
jgi:hypothetical protein